MRRRAAPVALAATVALVLALARQVRPLASPYEQFAVGPQLHMLEGAVQVTPEHFELDLAHHRARLLAVLLYLVAHDPQALEWLRGLGG
jgi:hypothetical protein